MTSECFFIHLKGRYVQVNVQDICYIISVAHNVKIVTERNVYFPHLSLKQLEAELPQHNFARVNRGVLVSLTKVISFDKENVYLKDIGFPFGGKFRERFEAKVTVMIHKESKK